MVETPRATTTLDRITNADQITIGYRADAAPTCRVASGQPAGYSVALCNLVANALKRRPARPSPAVMWVAVSSGFPDLAEGGVDLTCGADEISLANRGRASFLIPSFPGGVSALVRADADGALQDALGERPKPHAPLCRGTPSPTLECRTYSALGGSATMKALTEEVAKLPLTANLEPVADYDVGIAAVREHRSDVLLGVDRPLSEVYADPAFGGCTRTTAARRIRMRSLSSGTWAYRPTCRGARPAHLG